MKSISHIRVYRLFAAPANVLAWSHLGVGHTVGRAVLEMGAKLSP